ncbi:MAG: recombinase family protein [Clostridia bacterium]|nr:recombinase family protein [Clostridia bacterium]
MFPTEDTKFIWRPDTLRNIIRNRVYCGDCVMGKTDTKSKKETRTTP